MSVGPRPGHYQIDLVSGGTVLGTEAVDSRSQSAGSWAVEIRDLDDPHVQPSQRGRVCDREPVPDARMDAS